MHFPILESQHPTVYRNSTPGLQCHCLCIVLGLQIFVLLHKPYVYQGGMKNCALALSFKFSACLVELPHLCPFLLFSLCLSSLTWSLVWPLIPFSYLFSHFILLSLSSFSCATLSSCLPPLLISFCLLLSDHQSFPHHTVFLLFSLPFLLSLHPHKQISLRCLPFIFLSLCYHNSSLCTMG